MVRSAAIVITAGALLFAGTVPAQAAAPPPSARLAVLKGDLGIVGGAYPGLFHPTAGSVEVIGKVIAMLTVVGPSGEFRIRLAPGTYTVTGCGPTASPVPSCGSPRAIRLRPGQVDHVQLVWALVP